MSLRLKIILIILAFFAFAYLLFILMADNIIAPTVDDGSPINDPISGEAQTVSVARSFANGTHTVKGVISLPTPCYELTHDVMIMESYPEQVVIQFTAKDQGGICVQVIDERPFEVTFQASEQATVRATLNGQPLVLNASAN
jgi:hypothetical protein